MKLNNYIFLLLLFSLVVVSCDSEKVGTPKPRTYPRVEFPNKDYQLFTSPNCSYQFEYPKYAKVVKENKYFIDKAPNICWYNIEFPLYNGKIYLTYYPINSIKEFDKLVNDSFTLTSKHDTKASGRKEIKINNKFGTTGILFEVKGDVASQTQFFLSDTTSNFLRGSLYFNNRVNTDSMEIIQKFIDKDIEHLINTFKWK